MSDTYSPLWSPGDPLEDDEIISQDEKEEIAQEMADAGATAEEIQAYWDDDQEE